MRFRVATYNVHRCVGTDGRRSPERIARVIRRLGDPAAIALQEVESLREGPPDAHQVDFLAAATGLRAIAGPTILRPDRDYGNCLLTSAPVLAARPIDLTIPGALEPRGALEVDLDLGGRPVRVVATHLGLFPGERRLQVRRLLDEVRHDDGVPIVLLGDLNEWFPLGRPLRWLSRRFRGRLDPPATFPSRLPFFALDRVHVSAEARIARLEVARGALARAASDHLPLVASVEVAPGARAC